MPPPTIESQAAFLPVSRRSWLAGAVFCVYRCLGRRRARLVDAGQKPERRRRTKPRRSLWWRRSPKRRGWSRSRAAARPLPWPWRRRCRFRTDALKICESLARLSSSISDGKGFKLALPKERLTVITLKMPIRIKPISGKNPGAMVGGHYDLDTNRLVMFDFRPDGTKGRASWRSRRESICCARPRNDPFALLQYRTALTADDVPDWVSEGLATYVEMWRKNNRRQIGDPTARGCSI